jgi:hypothetical protein
LRLDRGYLNRKSSLLLVLLTLLALLEHGYHPAVEDGEIYLPGIKRILNPALYPFGSEFFLNHAHLTLFDELIAASVRISHVSVDSAIFIWYLASIFLTLLACWELSGECFTASEGRWGGVALLAALLTLPVAGTALYIGDQYLTPRSMVLFALLFAIRNALNARYLRFMAWSIFAAVMHPLMAAFGISYGLLVLRMKYLGRPHPNSSVLPLAMSLFTSLLPGLSGAYEAALRTRPYFFLFQWHWYEWIGIFGPISMLWWFKRVSQRHGAPSLELISRSLVFYGLFYFLAALLLTVPPQFETLARIQPMRSLHLIYVLLVVLGGGLLGTHVLRKHAWRWLLLFLPLCSGMWFAQRQLFPTSPHIEWPGIAAANNWLQAFDWIRQNTPSNAVFAIDPEYMLHDDQHGFRAIAERSRLADVVKDSGAVTMFPGAPVAQDWLEQASDQNGWRNFNKTDLRRLNVKYGVSWVVLERPGIAGLTCPYQNYSMLVCRLE